MFDMDKIENDWKESSFCLSDEEILEIFKSEGATWADYKAEVDLFNANLPKSYSAEDRLLAMMFHDDELLDDINRAEDKRREMYENNYPQRKHLSQESQSKVIEGCMDEVFDNTRYWFKIFKGKISMEKLYYICLYSLFDAVKYCLHFSTKSCFRSYIKKCIERNIIKNVAKWKNISYRHAYNIISSAGNAIEFCPDIEIPCKPSAMYETLKNESYDVDYPGYVSCKEFMSDYKAAINDLPNPERNVMELSYDKDGYAYLSKKQIAEFLVEEPDLVDRLKKSAIKKLRKDDRLRKYL